MNRDEIHRLYDGRYAKSYDDKFLNGDIARSDRDFELGVIERLLNPHSRWLDAACGTGFFLSQFPQTMRMGIDLSPAMLEIARTRNSNATFAEWDLRRPNLEWSGRWDLVTCMWYAYGLVDSMAEVLAVLENMADWTSPEGTLLLPFSDPRLIARAAYPYKTVDTPWDGEVFIEGILWSYVENNGEKCHAHQISPTPEFLIDTLARFFGVVDEIVYPPAMPGWQGVRRALAAAKKRPYPEPSRPRFQSRL